MAANMKQMKIIVPVMGEYATLVHPSIPSDLPPKNWSSYNVRKTKPVRGDRWLKKDTLQSKSSTNSGKPRFISIRGLLSPKPARRLASLNRHTIAGAKNMVA